MSFSGFLERIFPLYFLRIHHIAAPADEVLLSFLDCPISPFFVGFVCKARLVRSFRYYVVLLDREFLFLSFYGLYRAMVVLFF